MSYFLLSIRVIHSACSNRHNKMTSSDYSRIVMTESDPGYQVVLAEEIPFKNLAHDFLKESSLDLCYLLKIS